MVESPGDNSNVINTLTEQNLAEMAEEPVNLDLVESQVLEND